MKNDKLVNYKIINVGFLELVKKYKNTNAEGVSKRVAELKERGKPAFEIKFCTHGAARNADEVMNPDCIAYDQMKNILRKNKRAIPLDTRTDAYDFSKIFVCVDLSVSGRNEVTQKKYKALKEAIFLNGFTAEYADKSPSAKVHKVNFVRFEASANMLKSGRLMFVDETFKQELTDAITLGLDPRKLSGQEDGKDFKIIIPKWQANKGLVFSSGISVSDSDIIDNVVVVDDFELDFAKKGSRPEAFTVLNRKPALTASGALNEPGLTDNYKMLLNASDGVGFILPELAKEIRADLPQRYAGSTSFQFRMPFCKGMLHEVDFKEFFENELISTDGKNSKIPLKYIVDMFGEKHDINDVKIILTKSQFKVHYQWRIFAEQEKHLNGKNPKQYTNHWELYREHFRKYKHSLFITGGNLLDSARGNAEELNYQWLSTLPFTKEEYEQLLKGSANAYNNLKKNYWARAINSCAPTSPALTDLQITDENGEPGHSHESESENLYNINYSKFNINSIVSAGLHQNAELIKDRYVKTLTDSRLRSLEKKVYTGNILVEGKLRYLAPNLIKILLNIAKKSLGQKCNLFNRSGEIVLKGKETGKKKKQHQIFAPKLIADGKNSSHLYFALARSPHLAPNEHCLVTLRNPEATHIFSKYLGHLEGICMIDADSFIAERLGGADYDGDMIKIISDPTFVNAVKNLENLPLIKIPAPRSSEEVISEDGEWRAFFNSISSQITIGQYSNIASKVAQMRTNPYLDEKIKNNSTFDFAAMLQRMTLYVGLEIDSVKTGVKPILDSQISCFNEEYSNNLFINTKRRVEAGNIKNIQRFAKEKSGYNKSLQENKAAKSKKDIKQAEDKAEDFIFEEQYKINHPLSGLGVLFWNQITTETVGDSIKLDRLIDLGKINADPKAPVHKELFALLIAYKSVTSEIAMGLIKRVSFNAMDDPERKYSDYMKYSIAKILALQGYSGYKPNNRATKNENSGVLDEDGEISQIIEKVYNLLKTANRTNFAEKEAATIAQNKYASDVLWGIIKKQRDNYHWAFKSTEERKAILNKIYDELNLDSKSDIIYIQNGDDSAQLKISDILCESSRFRGYDLLSYFLKYTAAKIQEEKGETAITLNEIVREIGGNEAVVTIIETILKSDVEIGNDEREHYNKYIKQCRNNIKQLEKRKEDYSEVFGDDSDIMITKILDYRKRMRDAAETKGQSDIAECRNIAHEIFEAEHDEQWCKELVRAALHNKIREYDDARGFFWNVAGGCVVKDKLMKKGTYPLPQLVDAGNMPGSEDIAKEFLFSEYAINKIWISDQSEEV